MPTPKPAIFVCVLGGLLCNFAVAWVGANCSLSSYQGSVAPASQAEEDWWHENAPSTVASNPEITWSCANSAASLDLLTGLREPFQWGSPPWDQALVVRAGWPLPALTGQLWVPAVPRSSPRRTDYFLAKPPALDSAVSRTLLTRRGSTHRLLLFPLRPLLWGFALNTALYCLVPSLIVVAFASFRRRWRRRRHLCPSCGYPAGPSPRCSECGSSLPQEAAT
jgi:hypothetical protein